MYEVVYEGRTFNFTSHDDAKEFLAGVKFAAECAERDTIEAFVRTVFKNDLLQVSKKPRYDLAKRLDD